MADGAFDQSQRGGFVAKRRSDKCEIIQKSPIFWLILEKSFHFSARLPPGCPGRDIIAGHFLRPA